MGYAALEIFLGLGASTDGVAHFAHLRYDFWLYIDNVLEKKE